MCINIIPTTPVGSVVELRQQPLHCRQGVKRSTGC